jgi:hypothetical protein
MEPLTKILDRTISDTDMNIHVIKEIKYSKNYENEAKSMDYTFHDCKMSVNNDFPDGRVSVTTYRTKD